MRRLTETAQVRAITAPSTGNSFKIPVNEWKCYPIFPSAFLRSLFSPTTTTNQKSQRTGRLTYTEHKHSCVQFRAKLVPSWYNNTNSFKIPVNEWKYYPNFRSAFLRSLFSPTTTTTNQKSQRAGRLTYTEHKHSCIQFRAKLVPSWYNNTNSFKIHVNEWRCYPRLVFLLLFYVLFIFEQIKTIKESKTRMFKRHESTVQLR